MAFDRISPIGGDRLDILAAIIATTMANCMRGAKQSAYKIGDFIPKWGDATNRSEKSAREIQTVMNAWKTRINQRFGGQNGTDRPA